MNEPQKSFPLAEQLAAAVTTYPYEASQILGFFDTDAPINNVPARESFAKVFTFTREELRAFIGGNAIADRIVTNSLDQRGSPTAYVEPSADGYRVGWFDGGRKGERLIRNKDDAATEFVLLFWGLAPRRKTSRGN